MIAWILGFALLLSSFQSDVDDPPVDEVPASTTVDTPLGWPLDGALGARIYCIEGYESNHGLNMYNRTSGAAGYLQWLPSTARRWGVSVGDRSSEWLAAARMAQLGESFFRSQWVPLQRGWC